jgi:hypothetical protein
LAKARSVDIPACRMRCDKCRVSYNTNKAGTGCANCGSLYVTWENVAEVINALVSAGELPAYRRIDAGN